MIVLMQRKARLRVQGELEPRSQQFLLIALVPGADLTNKYRE